MANIPLTKQKKQPQEINLIVQSSHGLTLKTMEIKKVNLTSDFQLDVQGVLSAIDSYTKLIFICSPNNPTGNNMRREDVEIILNNFSGIVIIDEASAGERFGVERRIECGEASCVCHRGVGDVQILRTVAIAGGIDHNRAVL